MPPAAGTPEPRWRDPVLLGLALLSALYVVSFLGRDVFGVRRALGEREAYHLAFDATLLRNLLSYAGWTVNIASPLVRSVSDSIDPLVFPHAIAALIAWAAGLAVPALRRRGWAVGGLMFACLILPVLPLRNHTYHYYLYAPLAGAAWCVAAALDAALARTGVRTAARGGTAIALGALLTWNAALLVRKIETFPFLHPDLRADPIVDRARIAGNVHADLARARLPQGASLRFWSPSSIELDRAAGRDPAHESYWEQNVRNALMDGLAVRVLFPQVRSIEFVRAFPPSDNSHLYALYRLDGHLEVRRGSELDSLRRARTAPP